jgi:hypothetical protein
MVCRSGSGRGSPWGKLEAENCTLLEIGTSPSIDGKRLPGLPNSDLHPTVLAKAVTVFLADSMVLGTGDKPHTKNKSSN